MADDEAGSNSADEWEYEYEADQTEDHYIVLDLPRIDTRDVRAEVANPYSRDIFANYTALHPRYQVTKRRRKRNPVTGQLEDLPAEPETILVPTPRAEIDEVVDQTPAQSQPQSQSVEGQSKPTERPKTDSKNVKDQVRILDLHGLNPIIMFEGEFYSCKWAEALGTDMIFTKRPETDNDDNEITTANNSALAPELRPDSDQSLPHPEPLHTLKNWDLTAFASARLIASTAFVNRKLTEEDMPPYEEPMVDNLDVPEPALLTAQGASRVRQANFMNRLNALRHKKGQLAEMPPLVAPAVLASGKPKVKAPLRGGRGRGRGRGGGRGRGRGRVAQSSAVTTSAGQLVGLGPDDVLPTATASTSTETPASWGTDPMNTAP